MSCSEPEEGSATTSELPAATIENRVSLNTTGLPPTLNEIINSPKVRDVTFSSKALKTMSHDWLHCGRQDYVSQQAQEVLGLLLEATTYEEMAIIRSQLQTKELTDTDSKAMLAMMIFYGVKDYDQEDSSYNADRLYAYDLLQGIEKPTLISLQTIVMSYWNEVGPFDIGSDGVSQIIDDAFAQSQILESSHDDSQKYASHVIQDYRLASQNADTDSVLANLLRGEQLCEANAYFTLTAINEHIDAYLEIRPLDTVIDRLDKIIDTGVAASYEKSQLYDYQINYNSDYSNLEDISDPRQQNLILAAQEAYRKGISNDESMGARIPWCSRETEFICDAAAPFPDEYIELLEYQAEQNSNSHGLYDLSLHYSSLNEIDKAIEYKWREYQIDRTMLPNMTGSTLRSLAELIVGNYGIQGLNFVQELITEYKDVYMEEFVNSGDDFQWESSNISLISRYEDSLQGFLDLASISAIANIKPSTMSDIDLGQYYALLIANSDYADLDDLNSPSNDVEAIGELLGNKYGFQTETLIDASRTEILDVLNAYRNTLSDEDNFLLYYAGHGFIDPDNDEAYWQPVDSEINNDTNWISTNRIISSLRALDAHNIIVLADSCFSGALMREVQPITETESESGINLSIIQQLSENTSRIAISSGALEPVIDSFPGSEHSIFAEALIQFLESNNREAFSARDLHLGVSAMFNSFTAGTGLSQTPLYSSLPRAGHEGGDFIFAIH